MPQPSSFASPDDFPYVPADLIEALERFFPDRCPRPGTSLEDIHSTMGALEVVRFLRRKHEEQQGS